MPVAHGPGLGPGLSAAHFFAALVLHLSPALPFELRGFEHRRDHHLLKLHYGHPETHYEVWQHAGRQRMEVGLHFEGAAALNSAGLDFLCSRMVEIRAGLPVAELEPWDRGWVRIYETFPAPALDSGLAAAAAERLARYVTTLEPILQEFWQRYGQESGKAAGRRRRS